LNYTRVNLARVTPLYNPAKANNNNGAALVM